MKFKATAAAWFVACGLIAADKPPCEVVRPFTSPPAEFASDFGKYKSPLIFDNGERVQSPRDWKRRRQEILAFWSKMIGAPPELIARPKLEVLESKAREDFIQKRIRVEIAPKQTVDGYLLIPQKNQRMPGIVVPFYEPETSVGLGKPMLDFGYQLTKRGFVTLSIGSPGGDSRKPPTGEVPCQPLLYLGYVAGNCGNALANLPEVDPRRIGIVGHSYGGKWAMFASCFYTNFACAVWCDPGIVFDESRPNVNYWEPWYLGKEDNKNRKPGVPTAENPSTGPYKVLYETGHDLHELHALMAPRPFLVSGGSEDPPIRWQALNHTVAVNRLLGVTNPGSRVGMTNRQNHTPTPESNEQIYAFFECWLKSAKP